MASGTGESDGLRAEITLKDVLKQIWLGRSVFAWSICALLALACIDILISKPVYKATTIVAPVKALDQISSPEPILSASKLLGGGQDVTRFQIYIKRYTSVDIAAALERDHHLLRRVYAGRWDAKEKRWMPSHSLGTLLRRLFGIPVSDVPSVFDLRDYLSRSVDVDPGTGEELQTITVSDADPEFARQLLGWMHQEAESLAKQQASQDAQSDISYIESKLQSVDETEQRRVLINLLGEQENQLMLSQSGGGFAAQVIEAPAAPVIPTSPNPPLLLGLAIVGGCVLSIFANVLILLLDKDARPKKIALFPARFSHSVGANMREMLRSRA